MRKPTTLGVDSAMAITGPPKQRSTRRVLLRVASALICICVIGPVALATSAQAYTGDELSLAAPNSGVMTTTETSSIPSCGWYLFEYYPPATGRASIACWGGTFYVTISQTQYAIGSGGLSTAGPYVYDCGSVTLSGCIVYYTTGLSGLAPYTELYAHAEFDISYDGTVALGGLSPWCSQHLGAGVNGTNLYICYANEAQQTTGI